MSYRYLGNKTRLADWIVGTISRVLPVGSSIADPMCGTASVSLALARAGYSVTAADALSFPIVHARTRLLAKSAPAFGALGGYEKALEWMQSALPQEGYFFREFSEAGQPTNGRAPRLYFSESNAAHIDGIRAGIRKLYTAGDLTEVERSVLLHHLILATNKVANISGTYGYFRRVISSSALKPISFEPITFEQTTGSHTVMQGSVEELASKFFTDAVYLDPPYTKRQYAGNYHILETLAREDEPVAAGDGGLRPWGDQASSFCYRRTAGRAFRETLEKLQVPHVFISYSEDGQVPENELLSILSDFGKVTLHEKAHARYRSNGGGKDGSILERLYHIRTLQK
jgi:adenine-specific DNA-methyltransferase